MQFDDRLVHIRKFLNVSRKGAQRVLLTSLGVTTCIVAVRLAGLLQDWELATYDQMLRLRPAQSLDQRIVIVAIDEPDLRRVKQFPVPDAQMAELIQTLTLAKPRAIGLDIYRDLPVEPGHQALRKLFQTTPNLVGITHIGSNEAPEVPPPPTLPKEQVGFNNILLDSDQKVRRGLLYARNKGQAAARSFALVLAFQYLQQEGIEPKTADDQSGSLQLGKAVFRRFVDDDGGYVFADAGGYQILINPRGPDNTFQRVSISDVLDGKIAPEMFRDRIVLIGYTAISANDMVLMSYSSNLISSPKPIPGVELQANVISQIVSAAKGESLLLSSWSEPIEWVWIWLWAIVGAIISWQVRSLFASLSILFVLGVTVGIMGLGMLLQGVWIPVIPPVLAIISSAVTTMAHIARSQEELRRSKEFLSTIINTIPDPIYVKDRQHRWIVLNEAFANFLRQPKEALLERSGYDVFSQQEAAVFHYYDELVFTTGGANRNEEMLTDASGATFYSETKRSLHQDASGNVFLVGVIRDITERKRMEEDLKRTAAELIRSNAELQQSANQMNHLANHDPLTGLPNRKLFLERLEQALQWAGERQQLIGVLFLDLDGFKEINDTKGHDIGDLVLQTIAARLDGCLRGTDTVARLGGDEFTVILPAIPSPQDATRVAAKVLQTLANPLAIESYTIVITASVGISLYPHDGDDPETLLKVADHAMYQAKQRGKNNFCLTLLTPGE